MNERSEQTKRTKRNDNVCSIVVPAHSHCGNRYIYAEWFNHKSIKDFISISIWCYFAFSDGWWPVKKLLFIHTIVLLSYKKIGWKAFIWFTTNTKSLSDLFENDSARRSFLCDLTVVFIMFRTVRNENVYSWYALYTGRQNVDSFDIQIVAV